jgi:N-acetylglucosamine kinase-like BadF-type ATPase
MILIADSGGTKTEWRILAQNQPIRQLRTAGFNPYYQPIEHLHRLLREELAPAVRGPVEKIFFYGTGVSSEKNQDLVRKTLSEFFADAHIEIGWDLMAAARALCGHEPGIACILGTGSNSCHYDGEHIVHQVANLGWILADEGSGTYIGKQLIKDYFRQQMPDDLARQFHARYPFQREEVLERVYQHEKPGAFLAGFMKFIFQHLKDPYCHQLVYGAFADFYEHNVMRYPGYTQLKVHFTGSVAFYFSDVLRQAAADRGIAVKNIMEGPIAGLALYHQKDL